MHATRGHAAARARAAPGRRSSRTSSRSPRRSPPSCDGVPCATLIPHVYPHERAGLPDLLARRAPAAHRARARALASRAGADPPRPRARARRAQPTRARASACAPLEHVHGGISRELALVATFPQLEYPRRVAAMRVHVVGPLMWEPPAEDVELPPRRRAARAVAPSTAQDPEHRLLRAALRGPRRRARARARDVEPAPAAATAAGARQRAAWSTGSPTRARCPTATSSSATPGTARSCARSRAAAPSSRAPRSAT